MLPENPLQEVPSRPENTGALEYELFNKTVDLGTALQLFTTQLQQSRLLDQRWVAIARTHFQEGLSAARRAIMKNDRF